MSGPASREEGGGGFHSHRTTIIVRHHQMRHARRRRLVRFQSSSFRRVHIRLGARAWLAMGLIVSPVANSQLDRNEPSRKDSSVDRGEAAVASAEPAEAARVDQAGAGLEAAKRIKGGAVAGREMEEQMRKAARRPSPGRWRAAISNWGSARSSRLGPEAPTLATRCTAGKLAQA